MRLVILPGDGIGPEISAAAVEVLQLLNRKLALGLGFETHEIGLACLRRKGTTFLSSVLEACRSADGIVLGPVSHSNYPSRAEGGINAYGELRIQLDLCANIRPCRSRKDLARTRGNEPFARGASVVEQSVDALLEVPDRRTADLGGPLGTKAFTAALCEEITRRL